MKRILIGIGLLVLLGLGMALLLLGLPGCDRCGEDEEFCPVPEAGSQSQSLSFPEALIPSGPRWPKPETGE